MAKAQGIPGSRLRGSWRSRDEAGEMAAESICHVPVKRQRKDPSPDSIVLVAIPRSINTRSCPTPVSGSKTANCILPMEMEIPTCSNLLRVLEMEQPKCSNTTSFDPEIQEEEKEDSFLIELTKPSVEKFRS